MRNRLVQPGKKHLGRKLPIGATFYASTKRRVKRELIMYNPGDRSKFIKGKRTYVCDVIGLIETRTGFSRGSIAWPFFVGSKLPSERLHEVKDRIHGVRFWQFTYLVKIVEN